MNFSSWDIKPVSVPQMQFLLSSALEVLFGGSSFCGKTLMLVLDAMRQIDHQRYEAIIFRRLRRELEEVERYCDAMYIPTGAKKSGSLKDGVKYTWPSGATIELDSMEHETDWEKYHGRNFTAMYFDELVTFLKTQYISLMPWCRAVDSRLKAQIRSSTNPWPTKEGDGIGWIMEYFNIPEGEEIDHPILTKTGGGDRMFIPSLYTDNTAVDPEELERWRAHLEGTFPKDKYNAYIRGIWGLSPGTFFYRFSKSVHVKEHWQIEEMIENATLSWAIGMDHGTGEHGATCCLKACMDAGRRLYFMDQYYQANKPIAFHAPKIKEFQRRDDGKLIDRIHGDRTMWNATSSKVTNTTLTTAAEYIRLGLPLIEAQNNHEQGYRAINDALYYNVREQGLEQPYMYISDRCKPLIKEFGNAMKKGEMDEISNDGKYHSIASARYVAMALRPPREDPDEKPQQNLVLRRAKRLSSARRARNGGVLF